MVIREHTGGWLCIPQTQHAAVSGQIARAWGNDQFPRPEPHSELCLAAERHDDGMRDFDAAPELDPDTGLPRDFMRMPLDIWLQCWARGPAEVAEIHPYAGLLVSHHGTGLLSYRKLDELDPEDREAAEAYRSAQEDFRAELLAELEADARCSPFLEPESLERNRNLIALWDAISLALCMPRLPDQLSVRGEEGPVTIELTPITDAGVDQELVSLDPWPFSVPEVPLVAAGRRLDRTFEDEAEMREVLEAADSQMLKISLVEPGGAAASASPGAGR